MRSRQAPLFVFVDLTHLGHDERVHRWVLDSVREWEAGADHPVVWIAARDPDHAPAGPLSWIVHSNRDATAVAGLALAGAARSGADLLMLDGASMPDTASLRELARCFETDPHIGFAAPREDGFQGRLIRKIDAELGDPDVDLIPRSVIDSQPPHYLMRHVSGRCVLIRAELAREFHSLDPEFETLEGALQELMARARRCGFRAAVVNRALVESPDAHDPSRAAPRAEARARDLARLYGKYPEQSQVDEDQRRLSVHEYESLLGRAASSSRELSRSLIIDASEMGGMHNGSSEAALGILQGIHERERGWAITLLVPPEGARFHEFEQRFPNFELVWPLPHRRYTAAFRLKQPWSIQVLQRLHRMALFNFVFMLDTILDDIQLVAPIGLAQAWEFAARNADGLVYISRYTRDRMRQRFAVAPSVEECVSHLSTDPADYCVATRSTPREAFVYVVGNHYPHKRMDTTVRDLASAFPFMKLKTLGYENPAIAQLEGFPSGNLPQPQVDRLYAEARAIVFPSLYEGFGFPVVKGLAHGGTVIARDSELLDELAGIYRGPGRLIRFASSQDLVETLGRVLHGLPIDTVPLGAQLGPNESPPGWSDVAGRILDLIDERVDKPNSSNWLRRETELAAMEAFASGPDYAPSR